MDKFERLYTNPKIHVSKIGEEFGHSREWVYREATRRGLKPVRYGLGGIKLRPDGGEKVEQFRSDYANLTREELVGKYDVTWGAIKNWACDLGIKRGNATLNRMTEDMVADIPNYEELIDLAKEQSRLFKAQIYPSLNVYATIKTELPIALAISADWHLGSLGVDYVTFDKDIDTIVNTENLFVYVGGDGSENFMRVPGAPQQAGANQDALVVQRSLFIRTVEKLGHKLVALGSGNHGDWERVITGRDYLAELAKKLRIVYTQAGGMLHLTVGNTTYRIFRVHKARFSSTFNLTHCVKRLWEFAPEDFDIGIAEHKHEADIEPFHRHGLERWAVRTGTYLVFDDFARRCGFFGSRAISPTIVLYPNERRIVGFLNIYEAITYLKGV